MSLTLTPQEERVIQTLRQLPTEGIKEVEDFLIFVAARSVNWSYSDPGSLERAVEMMAKDPFLRREIASMNADFACAEGDGLEDY